MKFQVLSLRKSEIGGVSCSRIDSLCAYVCVCVCVSGIGGFLWEVHELVSFPIQRLLAFIQTFNLKLA